MLRLVGPLLLALGLATICSAQSPTPTSPSTLAERFGHLRQAYSQDSETPSEPAPLVQLASQEANAADGEKAKLPRIDPRALLPKEWFGAAEASDRSGRSEANNNTGSASSRLRRDIRRNAAITDSNDIADAIRHSTGGRAGSAISARRADGGESVTAVPQPRSRATAALARSIAADVAESLTGEIVAEPVEPEAAAIAEEPAIIEVAPKDSEESPKSETQADSEPASEARETPEEEPLAEAKGPAANSAAVAQEAGSTRLPLVIGDATPGVGVSPSRGAFVTRGVERRSAETVEVNNEEVLVSQPTPVIVSRVSGPRTIVVGREATYRVRIENRGDAAAKRFVARIKSPAWADVVGVRPSSGAVDTPSAGDGEGDAVCEWRLERLADGSSATLDLRIVARAGRPIELGVSWEHAPVDAMTVVEVQEPKLAMHLAGPDEVLFGKSRLYRLTVSNPGTGLAENVRLRLTPPGRGKAATEHDLGAIAAGDTRSVEIELTAREAGQLVVDATASADGGLTAGASKEILCRKAELAVDWRGPDHRYAGAPAVYYFRVRNPGTAAAQRVVLNVQLPEGFEITPSDETPDAVRGRLAYRVGTLRPGDDRYFQLRGVMRTAGANRLTLSAVADDRTASPTVTAETSVVALADLKLDIQDPRGPIPTGEEIAYKIRVTNRGATEAHDVSVVGMFSEGIEPHRAEGAGVTIDINDGRVAFGAIESIPAGAEREFTIYARAGVEGTHRFRTEVSCRELDIELAAEETTRFFQDEPVDVAATGDRYGY